MEDQKHQGKCLCLNNESRLKIGTLHILNLLFDFRESHAMSFRSVHIRNELIILNIIRIIKRISSAGVSVTYSFTNSGKTNSSGRHFYVRSMAHVNCIISPCAAKVSIFMVLCGLLREKCPDFSPPTNFCNMTALALDSDFTKKVHCRTQLRWNTFFMKFQDFSVFQVSCNIFCQSPK